MKHLLVLIALAVAIAETHGRIRHPFYDYGNHISGSGVGELADDEDYAYDEGSGVEEDVDLRQKREVRHDS